MRSDNPEFNKNLVNSTNKIYSDLLLKKDTSKVINYNKDSEKGINN